MALSKAAAVTATLTAVLIPAPASAQTVIPAPASARTVIPAPASARTVIPAPASARTAVLTPAPASARTVIPAPAAAGIVIPALASARAASCDPPAGTTRTDTTRTDTARTGTARTETAVPWQDRLYDPARLAPLADGTGVRVAVLDSGVRADLPQLAGRVAAGRDFLRGDPDGRQDCVGHGTAVAAIIAAARVGAAPLRGLAPGVTIVPVRVSEQEQLDDGTVGAHTGPAGFARAIDYASDPAGGAAQVINLSLVTTSDDRAVRRAVARALARGVVVVAAAGNLGRPGDANPTPYPAAYPGVLGVGAIGPDGARTAYSQHGGYVDVLAAGDQLTVAALPAAQSGTSFAAPFVSATAALIRQRFPALTPAEVSRRIIATADPAPGGRRSDEYGYGLLNPYRAVTETLGPRLSPPAPPVPPPGGDAAAAAERARRAHAQQVALLAAAAGTGLVAAVGVLGAVLRRGRRRGWRPGT